MSGNGQEVIPHTGRLPGHCPAPVIAGTCDLQVSAKTLYKEFFFFFVFKETRHHYRKFRKYRKEIEKASPTLWRRTVEQASRDSTLSSPLRLQFGQP